METQTEIREVHVDLTPQDIIDFNVYHSLQSPVYRRMMWRYVFFGLFWVVLCLILSQASRNPVHTFVALTPFWAAGLVVSAVMLLIWRPLMRASVTGTVRSLLKQGPNRTVLGPRRVQITPRTVTEAGEFHTTVTEWPAVEQVVVLRDRAYLFYGSFTACLLPRRSFPDGAAFAEFVQTARTYQAEASPQG